MGTGSSVQPKQGVLANPRVVYADQLAKKSKKKDYVIDAPVLIDLNHGSIRYRYTEGENESKNKSKKVEIPFEGEEKQKKGHYFYHPRLNDFSEKARVENEESHKFVYVVKGPTSAQQKKVFYVYGKGWNAKDGTVTRPTTTKEMGKDPTWPLRQQPHDVYYDLTFLDQEVRDEPIPGIPNRYKIQYSLSATETANDLRAKIAKTIIKSATNVHVCYRKEELPADQDQLASEEASRSGSSLFPYNMALLSNVIGELRIGDDDDLPSQFGIEVTIMSQ